MKTTRLILVGGFLGAGKTTLLWDAARRLAGRGLRTGLITNDQAPELVDTAFLAHGGVKVAEVSGSCFCCNFQGLIDAMSKVRAEAEADVLIAEPVGSCTDLSATIVQPLKEGFRRELVTAPLSVLADPTRLTDLLDGGTAGLHPSAAYILRKQLEEADIILISKCDQLSAEALRALQQRTRQAFPEVAVLGVSAKTGAGVDAWLDAVTTRADAGQRVVAVDYDVYAEGEAVLGWLNASIVLRGQEVDWNGFAAALLRGLSRGFDDGKAAVGHVKLMISAGEGFLIGNVTGTADTLSIRGTLPPGPEASLTLNARVQMSPAALDASVRTMLTATCAQQVQADIVAWRCLSPGRPQPTHRYDHVVPG